MSQQKLYIALRNFVLGGRRIQKNKPFNVRWADSQTHLDALIAGQLVKLIPVGEAAKIEFKPPTAILGDEFREALASASAPKEADEEEAAEDEVVASEGGEERPIRRPGRPSKHGRGR